MKKDILKVIILMFIIFPLFLSSFIINKKNGKNIIPVLGVNVVKAGVGYEVVGWAWSDNVGWFSFNCSNMDVCATSNYSVILDNNKELSGYAWSDNIGWVSFNKSDLSGCPSGTCKAWIDSSNNLKGWASALSGKNNNDGWDGWISLDCSNNNGCGSSNYGVDLKTGYSLIGYAWGSDVVGWIQFNSTSSSNNSKISVPNPTVNITLGDTEIIAGDSTTVSWSSQNTKQCTGTCSGDSNCNFSPGGATSGSHNTVNLVQSTIYSINCSDIFGNTGTDGDTVNVLIPNLQITYSPDNIKSGSTVYLTWSSSHATSCEVLGPNGVISNELNGTGVETEPVDVQSTFTLSCDTQWGVNFKESVTVSPLPEWKEF